MADVLVASFITDTADNQIDYGFVNAVELGFSDNGSVWGFAPIEAMSTSTADLTVAGDQIWVANRDGDGSNITVTSPSAVFAELVEQSSTVAPALTMLGQDLAIVYVGAATGRVEVVTSVSIDTAGISWSSKSITGQSSHIAPAAAVLDGTLWVAYVGPENGHVELTSWSNRTTWTGKIDTGQSTELPPTAAVFDGKLLIAYVNSSTGAIEVFSYDGQTPVDFPPTGQTTRFGPALTEFNGALWLAYIGAESGHLELISTSGGSSPWSAKVDTGRSSQCGPALTTIPAVVGPSPLVGNIQYMITAAVGAEQTDALSPLPAAAVQIIITDDLKFDASVPLSFQLNCRTAIGNDTLGMQQYVLMMKPNSTELNLHIQNFPPAGNSAVYGGSSAKILDFPDLGVIPAGWTFNLDLLYVSDDGVLGIDVFGMVCKVTNADGATVGSGSLNATEVPLAQHPGNADDYWLAPIVAMELNVVAWADGNTATLSAGHGFVVYSCLGPLQANPSWRSYVNSPGQGTAEKSNCVNGLIPVGAMYPGIVQSFGVPDA